MVLGTTRFRAALGWYLDTLGLIVSDFLYLDGQRGLITHRRAKDSGKEMAPALLALAITIAYLAAATIA